MFGNRGWFLQNIRYRKKLQLLIRKIHGLITVNPQILFGGREFLERKCKKDQILFFSFITSIIENGRMSELGNALFRLFFGWALWPIARQPFGLSLPLFGYKENYLVLRKLFSCLAMEKWLAFQLMITITKYL